MPSEIITHLELVIEGLLFMFVFIPAVIFIGVYLLFIASGSKGKLNFGRKKKS